MGARGGATKISAWRCPTCIDIFERRKDAVACCNDVMDKQRTEKLVARTRRVVSKVTPRVRVKSVFGQKSAVGYIACAKCAKDKWYRKTGSHRLKLSIPFGGSYRATEDEARKRAKSLIMAQFSRHVAARHAYD